MKAYAGSNSFAFMSYSHKDTERVKPLIDKLQNFGCNIWFDGGISPGDEWAESIAEHLEKSSLFFLILSENSIVSQNVKREIYYAVSHNIPILTFYLDSVEPSHGLIMQLGVSQSFHTSNDVEQDFEAIKNVFPKDSVVSEQPPQEAPKTVKTKEPLKKPEEKKLPEKQKEKKLKKSSKWSKKMSIITASTLLVVALIVTSVVVFLNMGEENSAFITRAEWVEQLGSEFGLTQFEQKDAYFSDVPSEHSAFTFIQSAKEWEVLKSEQEFNPDELATRSFVAETIMRTVLQDTDPTCFEKTSAELIQIAHEAGIMESTVAEEFVTIHECAIIIEKAKTHYLSLSPEEYENIQLKSDVIDLTAETDIQVGENFVYVPENIIATMDVGSVFIIPGEDGNIAKKVIAVVNEDGKNMVITEEPEIDEVFEELSFGFVGVPEVEDIVPLDEGITIVPITDESLLNGMPGEGNAITLGRVSRLAKDNFKTKSKSFEVKVNLTTGKLTPNVAFSDYFSVGLENTVNKFFGKNISDKAGELFKKTTPIPKYDSQGNLIFTEIEEWKGGYEITGSLKIKNMYAEVSYDATKKSIKAFSSKIHFTVESNLTFKGTLTGSVPVYKTVIPGPAGIWVEVVFSVYVDVNGNLQVGSTINHTTKVTYKNKKVKPTQETAYDTSVSLSGNLSSGIKVEAIPCALGVKLIDISAKAGAGIEVSATAHKSEYDSMICIEGKMYFPVVSVSVGVNTKTLANKLGIKATVKLVDKSGGLVKSATKVLFHQEVSGDGVGSVSKCTWGTKTSKPVVAPTPNPTPSTSTSGNNQATSSISSTMNNPGTTNDIGTTNNSETSDSPGTTDPNIPAGPGETAQEVASGQCGDSAYWTFCDDGTLVISGSGSISDYSFNSQTNKTTVPWIDFNESILSVVVESGITYIGNRTFQDCINLKSVYIADSVKELGTNTFRGCKALESIKIPNSVTAIGEHSFRSCKNLKEIALSENLTVLTDYLFFETAIESITLPKNVSVLESNVFAWCWNLKTITFLGEISKIDSTNYFIDLSISTIQYGGTRESWAKLGLGLMPDGPLGTTTVICIDGVFDASRDAVPIPCGNNVTWFIKDGVFLLQGNGQMDTDYTGAAPWSAYSSLTTAVFIEEGITNIGKNTFDGFQQITNITLPSSMVKIGQGAFRNCTGLTSVIIPDGVTEIGADAFHICLNLKEIVIPKSVERIGAKAFGIVPGHLKIHYGGAKNDWAKLEENSDAWVTLMGFRWNSDMNGYTIYCTDGQITG